MSEIIAKDVLVFAHPDVARPQHLSVAAARLITLAREITDGKVVALAPSSITPQHFSQVGVKKVYYFNPEETGTWQVGAILADLVVSAVRSSDFGVVLLPSTSWGRDAAGQGAILLGSGASVDVTSLKVADGKLIAGKSVLDGTWETSYYMRRGIPVVAMRTTSLSAVSAAEAGEVETENLPVQLRESTKRIQVVSREETGSTHAGLTEAPVVVCVGRGVNSDLKPAEELAEVLGGSVGATRVVCEQGWMDRAAQIGQSGISVAPNLYIGMGISGDHHHVCGIRGAKKIVAICDDPEARIFEMADFGVVGDLFTVVPDALSRIKPLDA